MSKPGTFTRKISIVVTNVKPESKGATLEDDVGDDKGNFHFSHVVHVAVIIAMVHMVDFIAMVHMVVSVTMAHMLVSIAMVMLYRLRRFNRLNSHPNSNGFVFTPGKPWLRHQIELKNEIAHTRKNLIRSAMRWIKDSESHFHGFNSFWSRVVSVCFGRVLIKEQKATSFKSSAFERTDRSLQMIMDAFGCIVNTIFLHRNWTIRIRTKTWDTILVCFSG